MKASGQNKVLELAQHRAKLLARAREAIAGTKEPDQAWTLLNEHAQAHTTDGHSKRL